MFVSLGSNCSITYQLNKYNKRIISFPFDWTKINIKQLISILENNFDSYTDLIIKNKSNNHELSYLITNKYNITFAHEVFEKYELEEFTKKLIIRINNFITNNDVTYIRIELGILKESYQKYLDKLCELVNNKLILIVYSKSYIPIHKNVKIYTYNNFSSDWKRDDIDWLNIFSN
jgi:hypothetical protein